MHFTAQQILLCPRSRQVQHAHFNAAFLGEFVGVRQQVREQLLQTQAINLYPIIAVETINEINAVAAGSQQRLQYVHCRMRQSRALLALTASLRASTSSCVCLRSFSVLPIIFQYDWFCLFDSE